MCVDFGQKHRKNNKLDFFALNSLPVFTVVLGLTWYFVCTLGSRSASCLSWQPWLVSLRSELVCATRSHKHFAAVLRDLSPEASELPVQVLDIRARVGEHLIHLLAALQLPLVGGPSVGEAERAHVRWQVREGRQVGGLEGSGAIGVLQRQDDRWPIHRR